MGLPEFLIVGNARLGHLGAGVSEAGRRGQARQGLTHTDLDPELVLVEAVQLVLAALALLADLILLLLRLVAVDQHGLRYPLQADLRLLVHGQLLGGDFLDARYRVGDAGDHRGQVGDHQNPADPHEEGDDEGGGGAMSEGRDHQTQREEERDIQKGDADDPPESGHILASQRHGARHAHVRDTGQHGHQERRDQRQVPADPFGQNDDVPRDRVGQSDLQSTPFLFAADGIEHEQQGEQTHDDVDDVPVVGAGEQGEKGILVEILVDPAGVEHGCVDLRGQARFQPVDEDTQTLWSDVDVHALVDEQVVDALTGILPLADFVQGLTVRRMAGFVAPESVGIPVRQDEDAHQNEAEEQDKGDDEAEAEDVSDDLSSHQGQKHANPPVGEGPLLSQAWCKLHIGREDRKDRAMCPKT